MFYVQNYLPALVLLHLIELFHGMVAAAEDGELPAADLALVVEAGDSEECEAPRGEGITLVLEHHAAVRPDVLRVAPAVGVLTRAGFAVVADVGLWIRQSDVSSPNVKET